MLLQYLAVMEKIFESRILDPVQPDLPDSQPELIEIAHETEVVVAPDDFDQPEAEAPQPADSMPPSEPQEGSSPYKLDGKEEQEAKEEIMSGPKDQPDSSQDALQAQEPDLASEQEMQAEESLLPQTLSERSIVICKKKK